jgi:hypothetical protein
MDGLRKATVLGDIDPFQQRRLLVELPGVSASWAEACVPSGSRAQPKVGDTVWVLPVADAPGSWAWLGVLPRARR